MEQFSYGKFWCNLKKIKTRKDISQVELVSNIGVGKSIISIWEKNKRELTLSKFFGVSIDYLAGIEK